MESINLNDEMMEDFDNPSHLYINLLLQCDDHLWL